MIAADEDALICDLAQTYGILRYREHPARLIATLAAGLRDDARIKLLLAGVKAPLDTLLLASSADSLSWLRWSQTEQARNGSGCPGSILAALLGTAEPAESPVMAFETGAEFEAARDRILQEVT